MGNITVTDLPQFGGNSRYFTAFLFQVDLIRAVVARTTNHVKGGFAEVQFTLDKFEKCPIQELTARQFSTGFELVRRVEFIESLLHSMFLESLPTRGKSAYVSSRVSESFEYVC